MLSDIRSRDGEGGDRQVKWGNKGEDLERIFFPLVPLPCLIISTVRCRLATGVSSDSLLVVSSGQGDPSPCSRVSVAALALARGDAVGLSRGDGTRRRRGGSCSGCHCLTRPHEVGKRKTQKPQNMIGAFPGADAALQPSTATEGQTLCGRWC